MNKNPSRNQKAMMNPRPKDGWSWEGTNRLEISGGQFERRLITNRNQTVPLIESIWPKAQTTDQEHHRRDPGPKKTLAHAHAAGNSAPQRMKTKRMMRDIQARIVEHTRRTIRCPKTGTSDANRVNLWLATEGHSWDVHTLASPNNLYLLRDDWPRETPEDGTTVIDGFPANTTGASSNNNPRIFWKASSFLF